MLSLRVPGVGGLLTTLTTWSVQGPIWTLDTYGRRVRLVRADHGPAARFDPCDRMVAHVRYIDDVEAPCAWY